MSSPHHALNFEIIDDLHSMIGDEYVKMSEDQVNQSKAYIAELNGHFAKGDIKAVERTAHSLKGSAGQVGLLGIYHLAKDLEDTAGAENASIDAARKIFEQLVKEFDSAVAALFTYLKK